MPDAAATVADVGAVQEAESEEIDKPMRATNVDYSIEETVTELPSSERGVRNSVLRAKVQSVMDEARKHSPNADGKTVFHAIAKYDVGGSAAGAMQSLRNYFGREGSGFTFATKRSGNSTILWASFGPAERKPDFPVPGSVPKPPTDPSKGGRPKVNRG
jgi:hypothetical protein